MAAARARPEAVMGKLSEAFTEGLGAYQISGQPSVVQEWDEKGAAFLGPLV